MLYVILSILKKLKDLIFISGLQTMDPPELSADQCCSVCCGDKAKPVRSHQFEVNQPSKIIQRALLNHLLTQIKIAKENGNISHLKTYSKEYIGEQFPPAVANVNSCNIVKNISFLKKITLEKSEEDRGNANAPLLQWLNDVFSTGDVLEETISMEFASEPLCLNISDQNIGVDGFKIQQNNVISKLCTICQQLIRKYIKHERMNQNIGSRLFKLILNSANQSIERRNISPATTETSAKTLLTNVASMPRKKKSIAIDITNSEKLELKFKVGKIPLSYTDVKSTINCKPNPVKRKRGRPCKMKLLTPVDNKAELKDENLDSSKSKCPFCNKIYSIKHSLLHNCLCYRNTLLCSDCKIFCSTYVRYEKHLQDYHHKKKILRCNLSECNQKFVSQPALKWHQHFHKVEKRTASFDVNVLSLGKCSETNKSISTAIDISNNDLLTEENTVDVSVVNTIYDHVCVASKRNKISVAPNSGELESAKYGLPAHTINYSTDENYNPQTVHVVGNDPQCSFDYRDNNDENSQLIELQVDKQIIATTSRNDNHLLPCGDRNANSVLPVLDQQEILSSFMELKIHPPLQVHSRTDNNIHLGSLSFDVNQSINDSRMTDIIGNKNEGIELTMPLASFGMSVDQYNQTHGRVATLPTTNKMHCIDRLVTQLPLENIHETVKSKTQSLNEHILLNHRIGDHEYQCPVCDNAFLDIAELIYHLNNHKPHELCKCSICFNSMNARSVTLSKIDRKHTRSVIDTVSDWSYRPESEIFSMQSTTRSVSPMMSQPAPPDIEFSISKRIKLSEGTIQNPLNDEHCHLDMMKTEQSACILNTSTIPANLANNSINNFTNQRKVDLQIAPGDVDLFALSSTLISNESPMTNEVQTSRSDRSNPVLSYVDHGNCNIRDQDSLPVLVNEMNRKCEPPFVENHEENFIPTTENLSVVKALEGSGGNALAPIEHLTGSVDDMNYFS